MTNSKVTNTLPVFTLEGLGNHGRLNRVYLSDSSPSSSSSARPLFLRVGAAFFAGVFVCLALVAQYTSSNQSCLQFSTFFTALLPTHVGTPEWHEYPPAEPTNAFPSMFPSKYVHI